MFDVLVSSIGGCGTSNFMEAIRHTVNINATNFRFGENEYKHISKPPKSRWIKKAVFMYCNPYNAVLSINNRKMDLIHIVNRGFLTRGFADKYIGKICKLRDLGILLMKDDPFQMKEQFDNWYNSEVDYPIMFLKLEAMFAFKDKIKEFLELPKDFDMSFLDYKKRESDYLNKQHDKIRSLLEIRYGDLLFEINKLDGCFIK